MAMDEAPMFYDIDHLRKMSVGKSVQMSPIRYSIVRSTTPRFAEDKKGAVPGPYSTDCAHLKTTASQSRGTFKLKVLQLPSHCHL